MVSRATPAESVTVPIDRPPSWNVTVPVGTPAPVTVAVNVTGLPAWLGLSDDTRSTAVSPPARTICRSTADRLVVKPPLGL